MKKIDFNKLSVLRDKQFWRGVGNKLKLSLRNLPRLLFIKHSHIIDVISVSLVLVLAGYLVFVLLYFAPSNFDVNVNEQQELNIGLLERLGVWSNERNQEKQRLLELSNDRLYKKPVIIE